jgi:hypothetical protein
MRCTGPSSPFCGHAHCRCCRDREPSVSLVSLQSADDRAQRAARIDRRHEPRLRPGPVSYPCQPRRHLLARPAPKLTPHRYGDRVIARGCGANPGVRAPRLESRARRHAASVSSPLPRRRWGRSGLPGWETLAGVCRAHLHAVWSPGCGGRGGELGGRAGAPGTGWTVFRLPSGLPSGSR